MDENKITKPVKQYQAITLGKAKKMANELTNFLEANKLVMNIAGKKYVPVEGWQFVGETQMGLTNIVANCERVDTADPKVVAYRAMVEVVNQQGTVISRGFAWCSNTEKKKKTFEEYAIASMSQTRAIGKAYRNILSWIVKMGGYEATPYEEMDKDSAETELANAKRDVLKSFNEAGITNSTEMIEIIEKVTGKSVIENLDDAMVVIAEVAKDNETN